jgi:hypothetical protein
MNNYIDNKKFYDDFVKYKKDCRLAKKKKKSKPKLPDTIGESFLAIATNISHNYNFNNYIFKSDMIGDAIENAIIYADNFDPKKSKSPFNYFTTIMWYAMVRRIQKEKKQLYIKYKSTVHQMVFDTLSTHDKNDETMNMIPSYLDMNNDKTNDFVVKFEESDRKKKNKLKKGNAIDYFFRKN